MNVIRCVHISGITMQRIDPDKYVYDKVEPAVIDVNGETQETYLIYDVVTNQPPPQVGKNFVFVLLNRIL